MAEHTYTGSFPLHTPGKITKASPSDVRRKNRSLIFSLLFPSNQCSRAELGRRTGLSRVAVSDVVNDMLDEGLIRENGFETAATGKGKRGTLLSIDTNRLRIISLDLSQDHLVQGAATDLLGLPQQRMEIALGPDNPIDVDMIVQFVDELRADLDVNRIIGIGICVPGVIDNGVIRESTALGWHDVDLKATLERRFGIPVTVTNDVVCSMLTERFFGQGGPNMLFVKNDRGIGSATLIDDVPVVGEHHAGGEIGHISIDPDHGPQCPCGKRGCMERLISATALRERMAKVPKSERPEIIRKAGEYLAAALAMPIGLLDITDVCVYGPADIINNTFLDAAQERLDRATASKFHARSIVRRCQCGADITLRGGAIAVIRHYIEEG
ncbi:MULTISPECIES: ROK family transcriptional regulator [Bifidobacterium]|uniref:ROK family transcriptional regulator n=1 Tax=Bifidobacterium TaxID=1678 RepID=UPI001BDD3618|nr:MULTISPECIES: ROK family transcriptional regulator [Bifidobacterium]MBT1160833.1 ROK family transcriptional regulator [Bifidobacterium sp. SO1]MBW3077762.1 ROK family transcriptional regulator [Bifidobacterium simiiventris]